ncbi:hypothetical protein HYD87_00930 [Mycoplasmopsis bovis]|nr:hypothetical protein [Mycoplasmopsis bovis]QQH36578.1 hypothetical protein HYD87_00930 [Mycoplasmopsis bovis]
MLFNWPMLLKKKLNVHGKYKFNYVHYVIDETNWEKYWPSQISKPIKITLARWDLKKFWKANCRLWYENCF